MTTMRYQPAIRFYGPHRRAVANLLRMLAGNPQTALGTVVAAGEEDEHGLAFLLPAGHVAVWDHAWYVVKDCDEEIVPRIVRSVLGGSLDPNQWGGLVK